MIVDELKISVGDRQWLAATLYRPDGDGRYGAVMEALPYRKDDITESYRSTYHRYAANGLAVLRVDIRGTGSSTGWADDEYSDQERGDLRVAIEWLAAQPWSNGNVGMFGTSYSGFNSLHMGAEGVPALKAIVATYATDDRYTDDVHYCGGVLRQLDLIDYPLYMVAMNALPPVPSVFGDGWRDEWMRRIEHNPPWLINWLEHPLDSDFWRRGSVRLGPHGAGYERMTPATMLIVGWADGYRNNSFRVIEQYTRNGLPWRMLAGPWVHKSPESARPGPNVDDDIDVIAFFQHHLNGWPAIVDAPGQVFVRHPVRPAHDLDVHPGRWVDVDTWPMPGLRHVTYHPERSGVDALRVEGDVGAAAWNSCGGGLPWGQPLDQRADNARSLIYDWPIIEASDLIGNGRVSLRVRSDQRYAHVSVKLCNVLPDGSVALITRGMLDLRHRGCWPQDVNGAIAAHPVDLEPGKWVDVEIELEATTWALVPGHTLRLAIAGTDWPNCWPAPGPLTLEVEASSIQLTLPLLDLPDSIHDFVAGSGPSADEADGVVWRFEHDVLTNETRAVTFYGGTYEGAHGAVVSDHYEGAVSVCVDDPAQAWVRGTSAFDITWPQVAVRTEAVLSVVSNAATFDVELDLRVFENGSELATRNWRRSLPR